MTDKLAVSLLTDDVDGSAGGRLARRVAGRACVRPGMLRADPLDLQTTRPADLRHGVFRS